MTNFVCSCIRSLQSLQILVWQTCSNQSVTFLNVRIHIYLRMKEKWRSEASACRHLYGKPVLVQTGVWHLSNKWYKYRYLYQKDSRESMLKYICITISSAAACRHMFRKSVLVQRQLLYKGILTEGALHVETCSGIWWWCTDPLCLDWRQAA